MCRDSAETGGSGPSVVRFAMPTEGTTVLDDLIRGRVTFENGLVDDFVLLKSDGFPTYHLASVVDDRSMGISHVFRGEEWLSSVPRHLQLYEALGWEPPLFVHLPQILAPDRSKLSKRHGAVSVREYREMGYLPGAMVNFLALLGWSLDDKTEVMSTEELTRSFSLERVSKSGAMFDTKKLEWMNGHYIRGMEPGDLADALLDHWRAFPDEGIDPLPERDLVVRIVPLIQERLKTLAGRRTPRRILLPGRRGVRRRRAGAEEDGRGGHEAGPVEVPRRRWRGSTRSTRSPSSRRSGSWRASWTSRSASCSGPSGSRLPG